MKVVVTGAAGFIGSHVCERLRKLGWEVAAFDREPVERAGNLGGILRSGGLTYHAGDLGDGDRLAQVLRGAAAVWHFGASADIPAGAACTDLDLSSSVAGTRAVLEAMRRSGTPTIVFPSTSAVYGTTSGRPVAEDHGPLLPVSLYGAGKLGAEGLVSAYCHLFGLRGLVFRLGNVLGGRMPRGVVRDFILKLREDPAELHLLGSGRQRKSFVLVDDCVDGMVHFARACRLDGDRPCEVFNIAAGGSLAVLDVARVVAGEMGLRPRLRVEGERVSWPGDQPVVELDVAKAAELGWRAAHGVDEAVRITARRLSAELTPDRDAQGESAGVPAVAVPASPRNPSGEARPE